MSEAVGCEKLA